MKPQFKPGYKEPYWTAIEDAYNPDLLKPDHVSWGWTNDDYDVEKERKGHVFKSYQESKAYCDAYNKVIYQIVIPIDEELDNPISPDNSPTP